MVRKLLPAVGLSLFLLVIAVFGGAGNLAAQNPGASIKLQGGSFNPNQGERPDLPPGLSISGYASGVRGYYIVQFQGPVRQSWKEDVEAAGAELLDYIPDFAFKVRMNPAQAARVNGLGNVAWVGLFQPAYKLNPSIDQDKPNLLRVRLEYGAQSGQTMAAIAQSGAEILAREGDILLVAAYPDQIVEIANVLDVAWMENYVYPQKHNEYGAGVILGANTAHSNGYDGSSQIAAVSDTGLGNGTLAGAHSDIAAGRITSIYNWPGSAVGCFASITNDGAIDVDSGHGTHTAVSVLGDGGASGEGKGTAPAASLVFQATENWATITGLCQALGGWPANGYFLTGLPDDLRTMYQQAYNDGARIHSNSWGSSLAGEYTTDSANTDDFVWDNPDMAITFSAGNEGVDANANGVVDNDSIGSPATAKNVITVGASENDRADDWPCDASLGYTSHDAYQPGESCSSMSGLNRLGTWGERYGNSFLAEPLFSDVTAGSQEQMASWSSRGPTDDGRIKPDVVAPGTWILSGFSSNYQEGYGDPVNPQNGIYQWDGWGMPFNGAYKYMGGTSMSNPIVAGAATVVRDYYEKAHSHNASAALTKATLINSAIDLADENNDGANDNDYPIPNVHEGWGRVNLANATDGSFQFVEDTTGIGTSGSASYQYSVSAGSAPLKVTLVWSDFPSTETAGQNLVNNLNLVVTAPGGAQYRGNVFSNGWSQTGGSADGINNVENVYIPTAANGTWTVQVNGANVPNGPQPYALVVDGNFGAVDNLPGVTITNPSNGATVSGTVNITATASDDNGVTQVEFFVDGGSVGVDTTAPYAASWDSATSADASHTIEATATDTIGQTDSNSINITTDNFNDDPVASFTTNCTGLSCDFDGSGSSDADGTITDYSWDFGDGNVGNGENASHTYDTAGTYSVMLTVTDDDSATGIDMQSVIVDEVPTTMHVGDLDGTAGNIRKNWQATVTISIHNANHQPVMGADVSGSWSGDSSGSSNCTTNSSGICTVNSALIPKKGTESVIFTVTNVSASLTYSPIDNHDPEGNSSGTAIQVNKDGSTINPGDPVNQAPSASFIYSCDDVSRACSYDASGSVDPDGTIATYAWNFGDGNTGSGVTPSHSYDSDGGYDVVLSVTDNEGATGTDTQQVTVGSSSSVMMHVGDLDGSSTSAARNRWNATVFATVHDADENPVANATVDGVWSEGANGGGSCDTNSAGQCSITKTNIKGNSGSATFAVTSVSRASDTYSSGANHDPDGDSNGTIIVVSKP